MRPTEDVFVKGFGEVHVHELVVANGFGDETTCFMIAKNG